MWLNASDTLYSFRLPVTAILKIVPLEHAVESTGRATKGTVEFTVLIPVDEFAEDTTKRQVGFTHLVDGLFYPPTPHTHPHTHTHTQIHMHSHLEDREKREKREKRETERAKDGKRFKRNKDPK